MTFKQSFRVSSIVVIALIAATTSIYALFSNQAAQAVSPSDWKPGRIIDDAVFYNKNSMSAAQIQDFLNAKVPNCNRWRSTTNTANQPPYTCLKEYQENTATKENNIGRFNSNGTPYQVPGGKSAAQIIWEVGQQYGINPQVLIVMLQKEQSLITDDWPWRVQYQKAMGYACPDTAPCDAQYYGFYNQVDSAAWQMKRYIEYPNSFNFKAGVTRNILWSPNTSCGSSPVYIENAATAALYNYTPYQPNAAAVNNLYGTGDGCSAYGNRNFWRMFNDWFGSSTNDRYFYKLIKSANSPALYLQTPSGKHYVPSGEILAHWGLQNYPINEVTQQYLDSLPEYGWVGKLLKDDWNNMFIVDSGKLHYVRSLDYLKLWGINPASAVQSLGISQTLPSETWAGRFAKDSNPSSAQIWLIDEGKKRAINDSTLLYEWRYTPDQLTLLSTTYLNSLPTTADPTGIYANFSTTEYVINAGRKILLTNSDLKNAYLGSSVTVAYGNSTLNMLPTVNASQFVIDKTSGAWYLLENGKKHYINSAKLAEAWGKPKDKGPLDVSNMYLSSIQTSDDLTYLIKTENPSQTWIIAGQKLLIPSSSVLSAWQKPGSVVPTYSNQSINHLSQGADITSTINGIGSKYTYIMDGGYKRYLSSDFAKDAWAGNVSYINNSLVEYISEKSFINYIIKDSNDGQAYLAMDKTLYRIDANFYSNWGINNSTPTISTETIHRYSASSLVLKAFVKVNGSSYLMNNGSKLEIGKYNDAFLPNTQAETILPRDYFQSAGSVSYLIKMNNPSVKDMWLVTQGKKILLSKFEQQVSYGYLSKGVQPTQVSQATLELIPTDARPFSLLIAKPGSGVKFISFGNALSFPNGDTLLNTIGSSNQVLTVSPSIFDSFSITQNASRLIVADGGHYYFLENGTLRHVATGAALNRLRSSNTVTYLEGTTINLIPLGTSIIN